MHCLQNTWFHLVFSEVLAIRSLSFHQYLDTEFWLCLYMLLFYALKGNIILKFGNKTVDNSGLCWNSLVSLNISALENLEISVRVWYL